MSTWHKLLAWTLTDFRRIALIDGDVWIAHNIDWLFGVTLGRAQVAATSVGMCYYFGLGHFNSGIVLLQPSESTFRDMSAFASNVSIRIDDACEGGQMGDQSFLNTFFRERWMQLPPTVVSHHPYKHVAGWRRQLPHKVTTGRWESFDPDSGRPGPWQAIMPHIGHKQSKHAKGTVCQKLCQPNKQPRAWPPWMSHQYRAFCWCWVPRENASDAIDVWHAIGASRGNASVCEMFAVPGA